jgi:hypothetical protein
MHAPRWRGRREREVSCRLGLAWLLVAPSMWVARASMTTACSSTRAGLGSTRGSPTARAPRAAVCTVSGTAVLTSAWERLANGAGV